MNKLPEMLIRLFCLIASLSLVPTAVSAFDSGSTGADGAFNPTVNTTLQVPPDGIFNFTSVDIPAGVTVGFASNASNTPVTILASGDVNIAGTLHVNGAWGTNAGASGDGNIGDDGIPGKAALGGYAGGQGGAPGVNFGQRGLGPGGGKGAHIVYTHWRGSYYPLGGGGGGFGSVGARSVGSASSTYIAGGLSYGASILLPLVGGSGGGGGHSGTAFHGAGGGAGGGAILIAATGTLRVTGAIRANGGNGGGSDGSGSGGTGGGGSGGAIRLVATQMEGDGPIQATGGSGGHHPTGTSIGGSGGDGRIRLEAEAITRTAATSPAYSFGQPSTVFISGLPTLRITSVAGVVAPAYPTGNADIVLPADTPNPVTVAFESIGVPVGNTIELSVIAADSHTGFSVVSPALVGTTDLATATVDINLPSGPSSLLAQTTYTILASQGNQLAAYTEGERVERVRLSASLTGGSTITLITISGKEYELPSRLPGMPGTTS